MLNPVKKKEKKAAPVPLDSRAAFFLYLFVKRILFSIPSHAMKAMETVPEQEIEYRIRNFQLSLQEIGLDGAFILQNADLFYFSGTIQSSALFIPQRGEPVLMVQKGLQRARHESPLKHVFSATGKDQVNKALRDFGFSDLKRIGLEMDVLPVNLYLRYRQTFPEYDWSDVSGAIQRLRMIKTLYEVEQIRSAARILHKGCLSIKEIIQEGMTELETTATSP